MTAPYEHYRATSRFGSLDGLRFLCIAAVLWHHSPMLMQVTLPLLKHGHLGVHFFFILPGYLISTLLLNEEDRTGGINLLGFYWRRALHILPVYFLVVGIAIDFDVGGRRQ